MAGGSADAGERTLFVVKPDAVGRGLVGEIVSRFEAKGFRLVDLRMLRLARGQAESFYAVHRERPFFADLVGFITSGPVVAGVLEGRNAVATVRTMVGATKSFEAAPGSIRGDLGLGFTDNVIHASDSAASYEHEHTVAFGR